ncbi:MAG: hypothetical protein IEMM0008_1782 [bacterium]|nr:MAG: hypothetical protein IEMM0008_1782 [bacterium]
MSTLKLLTKIDSDGHLRLDLATQMPAGDVELVITVNPIDKKDTKYDFSDLSGKLSWIGDPVTTQRSLRDEWS